MTGQNRGNGESRHDPRLIRRALAEVATPGAVQRQVADRYRVNISTLRRWTVRRSADPSWPSDADVAAWDEGCAAAGRRRARAVQQRSYRRRRYLQRGPMHIDPTGSARRLRALSALGWTGPQLAARLGWTPARVGHLMVGRWEKVHRDTAAAVAALYDELAMTVPQDPDVLGPKQTRIHDRTRRQAARKGWAPPLAWDDDDIDDPAARPAGFGHAEPGQPAVTGQHPPNSADGWDDGHAPDRILDGDWRLPCSRDDKVEVVARWLADGRPLVRLEEFTGWNANRYAHAARRLLDQQRQDRGAAA